MGFLKRIFSIGSKKQKKRKSLTPQEPSSKLPSVDEEQRRKLEEEEHEAAVGRLLRSSSSRYAVVKEVDYSNLPPIPHPINDVLAHCLQQSKEGTPSLRPSRSNQSLASSTLSHRSTYSVTIRDRQRHTTTEFPNANGHYDDNLQTPRNPRSQFNESNHPNGHALGLRSDPSVASLVELYDDHGRLPPETFSNSPPSPEKQGRQQKMRSGSTLRELLGATDGSGSATDSAIESDISWAERFLGEADSVSSQTSSFGPHTPSACTNDSTGIRKSHDLTFSTDVSAGGTNDPAISSMEVELSVNSDDGGATAKENNPYRHMDPTTPQRASQVFSFLTKRSTVREERRASDARDAFSTPVAVSRPRARLSTDSSIPGPRASRDGDLFEDNLKTPMQRAIEPQHAAPAAEDEALEPKPHQVRVLMSGPTKVIVTAPTPGTSTDLTPSRIPIRGPRQPPKRRSTASRRTPMLTHRINSTNRNVSPRSSLGSKTNSTGIPQRKSQSRTPSNSSTVSSASSTAEADAKAIVCGLDYLARSKTYHSSPSRGDKENQPALTAQMDLPSTPLRSHTTSKSVFRKAVTPGMFQPPDENSPPSPSELTPVGKQIMVDARKQRMRAKYGSGRRPSRI